MAEAAGLVLAVAALVLSSAEHYSTAAKCIRRYCRYNAEHEDLVSVVNIQRIIFRKTVEHLLAHNIGFGGELASEMFKNLEHPRWKDEEIETYFTDHMADSIEALREIIRLLNGQLQVLHFDMDNSTTGHNRVGKKLHFATSKSDINEAVTKIRTYTQDFRTLIKQTSPPEARNAISKPSWSTRNRVAKFATVKSTANNLYEALEKACTTHTSHEVRLSLQPTFGGTTCIRFTIGFCQNVLLSGDGAHQSLSASEPAWLSIESTLPEEIQSVGSSNILAEAASSLKRPSECLSSSLVVGKPKKLVKSVRFNPNPAQSKSQPIIQPSITTQYCPPKVDILNLCTHSNFCSHLEIQLGQSLRGIEACVGYLECSRKLKHLIYIKSRMQTITPATNRSLKSLRDRYLKVKNADIPTAGIPLHERVTLAKQLATAVLQFHPTPWLANSIGSDDVLLPGNDELSHLAQKNTREPFVKVSITGPKGPLARRATFPSRTLIRNRILFSLGIILLELAYQCPLNALQKPADIDCHESQNTDYYTADRTRHTVAAILGTRYAEVVRKCIQCDFGHGDDLGQTKLQEAFHQDVICELEALEDRFRKLDIDL